MALQAPAQTWSIAQIAAEFDVTHRTVRFYEDQGLISPSRQGSQRIFTPRDRVRLALVLRGKRLGFSLDEIRRIVDMYDAEPGEVGQLRYLIEQVERRTAELLQRQLDIEQTLEDLARVKERCLADLRRLQPPAAEVAGPR